jgi:hypothetical protein
MSLTFATPPADGLATLKQGLQMIQAAQQLDPKGARDLALAATPSVTRPLPVYELGLDDLANGKGLEATFLVAWRYLLAVNDQIRQAAEIFPDPQTAGTRFGFLTTGFVNGVEEAFRLAEQLPVVANKAYEIRALRVPALYVVALWLKDLQGDEDRFIVIPPAFAPVQILHPYSTDELLAILHPLAAHKAPLERQVTPP